MKKKVLFVTGILVIYFLLNGISSNCRINQNCYLCLELNAYTNEEFSPAKFNQIKKGWTFEKVDQLIGKPLSQQEIGKGNIVAFYSDEKNFLSIIGYTSFQIYFDNENKVVKKIVCQMD